MVRNNIRIFALNIFVCCEVINGSYSEAATLFFVTGEKAIMHLFSREVVVREGGREGGREGVEAGRVLKSRYHRVA